MKILVVSLSLMIAMILVSANNSSNPSVSTKPDQKTVSLAFVGDIMLARGVGRKIASFGIDYPVAKVKNVLSNADIAFGNLEGTLTGNQITGSSKNLVFRSPPGFGRVLVSGGIDIVSLANNHTNDGGSQGITDTLTALKKVGIKHVGAGENVTEARSLRVLDVKGRKIGFLAYTDLSNIGLEKASATASQPGVASANTKVVLTEITAARKKVDFLVVSFHWGQEYRMNEPTDRQSQLAHKSIEAGADIIIGHHPHVLEKIETYRGKTIAYSLGNFIFDNHRPTRARTMILRIDWDPRDGAQRIKVIPCYIHQCRPEIIPSK